MSRAAVKFLAPILLLAFAPTPFLSSQDKPQPQPVVPSKTDAEVVASEPELIGATSFDYLAEFKIRNVPQGSAVIWDVIPETGGTSIRIIKTEKAILVAGPPREYSLKVRLIKGEDVSEFRKNFKLTGGVAPLPPGPGPEPGPGPGPIPPPEPPAPIPGDGLRVLIVYQDKDMAKYSPSQLATLTGIKVRGYLDTKAKEYRIWDADVMGVENESKTWQDAFARPHPTVVETTSPNGLKVAVPAPRIIISNGKTGYEGNIMPNMPLDDVLALLQKYGG